jgi:DNA modification methylase
MVLLSGVFNETPINRQEINQKILDIEDKQRTNPLPWKGQFSPQFIEALIDKYADKNSIIFDLFLGSGTVLYEARRCRIEAYGTDINPAAFTLASIYRFINLSQKQRDQYTNIFLERLKSEIYETMPLFQKIPKEITPNDLTENRRMWFTLISF